MGWFFLESFGEEDTYLIEKIAKLHKVDKDLVEKYYKEMLEKVLKEKHE